MALTEQRIINSVQVLPQRSAVHVQWVSQVLRNGEVIAEVFERKAYTQDNYSDFLTEVTGAESYASMLGWSAPTAEQ